MRDDREPTPGRLERNEREGLVARWEEQEIRRLIPLFRRERCAGEAHVRLGTHLRGVRAHRGRVSVANDHERDVGQPRDCSDRVTHPLPLPVPAHEQRDAPIAWETEPVAECGASGGVHRMKRRMVDTVGDHRDPRRGHAVELLELATDAARDRDHATQPRRAVRTPFICHETRLDRALPYTTQPAATAQSAESRREGRLAELRRDDVRLARCRADALDQLSATRDCRSVRRAREERGAHDRRRVGQRDRHLPQPHSR